MARNTSSRQREGVLEGICRGCDRGVPGSRMIPTTSDNAHYVDCENGGAPPRGLPGADVPGRSAGPGPLAPGVRKEAPSPPQADVPGHRRAGCERSATERSALAPLGGVPVFNSMCPISPARTGHEPPGGGRVSHSMCLTSPRQGATGRARRPYNGRFPRLPSENSDRSRFVRCRAL